jgi:hypothetical protein
MELAGIKMPGRRFGGVKRSCPIKIRAAIPG